MALQLFSLLWCVFFCCCYADVNFFPNMGSIKFFFPFFRVEPKNIMAHHEKVFTHLWLDASCVWLVCYMFYSWELEHNTKRVRKVQQVCLTCCVLPLLLWLSEKCLSSCLQLEEEGKTPPQKPKTRHLTTMNTSRDVAAVSGKTQRGRMC